MTLHSPSVNRQYFLRKTAQHRRFGKSPAFKLRLIDEVQNQGAVIKRIEEVTRQLAPTLKVRRSSRKLLIGSDKKCAMYNLLDPIVADAIRTVADTSKHREKVSQDYRHEREFKRSQQANPIAGNIAAITLATRIDNTSAGWIPDPLELIRELAEGLKIPATA